MRNSGKRLFRPDTPPSTPDPGVAVFSGFSPAVKENRRQGSGYDSDVSSAVPDFQISHASLFLDDKPPNGRHSRPSGFQTPIRTEKQTEERRHRRKMGTPENQWKTENIPVTPCPSPSHRRRHSFCSASSSKSSDLVGIKNVPPKLSHFYTGCEKEVSGRSGVGEEEVKISRKREAAKMLKGAKGVDDSFASAGAGAGCTGYDANEEESQAMQIEKGYDGDVEMEDVPSCGGSKSANTEGAANGPAGDVEMGDVPPPHEANGGSSGSSEFGSSDPPVKQTEEEGHKGRKRVRWSEEVDVEEKRRECEKARKWRKSQSGSWPCQ